MLVSPVNKHEPPNLNIREVPVKKHRKNLVRELTFKVENLVGIIAAVIAIDMHKSKQRS